MYAKVSENKVKAEFFFFVGVGMCWGGGVRCQGSGCATHYYPLVFFFFWWVCGCSGM